MSEKAASTIARKRNCPICGSGDAELLHRHRFYGIEDVCLLEGYDVVICRGCGFGFADQIPEQAAFDAYYRDLSKYEYQHRGGHESEHLADGFRAVVDVMVTYIPALTARIVEIGCATAGLLAVLKSRGYYDLTGVDPSARCVEAARRLFGLRAEAGTLTNLPFPGEIFDFAILTGVLEHVRDLDVVLENVKGVIGPGGLIYIGVPDATEYARWPNAPYQHFSVEHINFFSPNSLANLMAVHGFETVGVHRSAREQGSGSYEPFIRAVFRRSNARPTTLEPDRDTGPMLREYLAISLAAEQQELRVVSRWIDEGKPIIVWGVGTLTQRLLATTRLRDANIRAFVDSNSNYHGKTLRDTPIIAPEALQGRDEPILIASWMYRDEIRNQIRDDLRLPNEMILLYES